MTSGSTLSYYFNYVFTGAWNKCVGALTPSPTSAADAPKRDPRPDLESFTSIPIARDHLDAKWCRRRAIECEACCPEIS